jgi:hypothetical protein
VVKIHTRILVHTGNVRVIKSRSVDETPTFQDVPRLFGGRTDQALKCIAHGFGLIINNMEI